VALTNRQECDELLSGQGAGAELASESVGSDSYDYDDGCDEDPEMSSAESIGRPEASDASMRPGPAA
jgi:hypothetical protein